MRAPLGRVPLGLAVVLGASACGLGHAEPEEHGRFPVPPAMDSTTAAREATLEPGALATVPALRVEGWTGPGGRPFEVARRSEIAEAGHARQFGRIALPIALRTRSADVSQYPCTTCHAGRTLVLGARRVPDAHQNIRPLHPEGKGTGCRTCHAAEDVARLVLASGRQTPLDESYRLCGQCHFPEANAWAGGGHGKRLDGWQGRRVVMACADCHDPHAPAVEPRIPFRAPELTRPRRSTP